MVADSEVETLAPGDVRAALAAIERAHQSVTREVQDSRQGGDDADYWQGILETNAAAVIDSLEHVRLADDYAVRYRFFERRENELRVRPFVARATTDVTAVRAALAWHAPPDSGPVDQRLRANRDADLLYKHFSFADSAIGVFHYWLAMQEVWASADWVHTRVVTDRQHFAEIVGSADWQIEQEVETHAPLVLRRPEGAHLAMLLYSPLHRHSIALQQIEIDAGRGIVFAEPITVAAGPRGYIA